LNGMPKRVDVQIAKADLRGRTLVRIPRALDRLVYLASMRDYNTGLYYHDGLAARFSEETACEAIADCHREAFQELLISSLEELVAQLSAYMDSTHTHPSDFLAAWKGLEPYRVAVPVRTDPLSTEFLFSNLKIALAVLESRLNAHLAPKPGAWQPQSLGL
jgi:hypothetical protein